MIRGLGIDLVKTERVREVYARFGRKFARRILAEGELPRFDASHKPVSFLAMRFAAKEAASKALGTGFRQGVSPRQIEVTHDAAGKPSLHLHGAAAEHAHRLAASVSHVSLTDEAEYAAAVVILES
ncbi:MAG: holo-ACP synthase [Gammaproteobacteria bacterium]